MSPRIRKATAIVSAAALLGGGGIGIAQAASGTSARARPLRPSPGRRPDESATLAKIASTLGVTTAQLKAAMPARRRPSRPTGSRPAAPAWRPSSPPRSASRPRRSRRSSTPTARPSPAAGRGAGPPAAAAPSPSNTKLVAALASGLGIDEATVKAAFDKIEAAHRPSTPPARPRCTPRSPRSSA